MLDDNDIAKLCYGRIIKTPVYNSAGTDATRPHYAVMLDSDAEIAEHDDYYVAVISTKDYIDTTFILPVPAHTGLKGFVICSWRPMIALAGIEAVLAAKLSKPEMLAVEKMIRAHQAAKRKRE